MKRSIFMRLFDKLADWYVRRRFKNAIPDRFDPNRINVAVDKDRAMMAIEDYKWGSDDWGRDLHQNFVNEIRLCKAVKDNVLSDFFFNADISEDDKERMSRKQNDMFLPFLLYECGIFNRTIKEKALSLGKSQEAVRKDYYYIDDDIWSFISDQTMKYIHPQIGEWDKMEEDIKKVFRQRINYIRRNLRS